MSVLIERPWLFFFVVAGMLSAVSSVGGYISLRTGVNTDSSRHEQIKGLRDGLFVLVGLLLGFTIALALPRFDQRRQLEIEEANSIGTTRLRAEFLPEAQRTRTLELLREYIGVRIEYGIVGRNREDVARNLQRTNALQAQLWQQAVEATREHPTPITSTYIVSLNETIDITESRLAAFENRVPLAVWLIVLIVAIFQSFVTGFSLERKFWFPVVVTPVVVAVVLALVADLDSPRTGLIRVEQESMKRLALDPPATAK